MLGPCSSFLQKTTNTPTLNGGDRGVVRILLFSEVTLFKYNVSTILSPTVASELGFVSENAQKYMRKGSDHHKTMSVLRVAHIGLWKEMLIPYIRDRLESGSPEISVNDYLYKWMPEVGWKSATYSYIFGMTYTYLMALMVLRMGVRRNNSSYIRAGQLSFAPLFHRSSSSKYALIDLHDR